MNQRRWVRFLAAGAIILAGFVHAGVALAADPVNDFKVGDWAQVLHDGQWTAVTIASPLDSGEYKVNFLLTVLPVKANPAEIRHYTPTAADRQAVIDLRVAMERLNAAGADIDKFVTAQETGAAKPPRSQKIAQASPPVGGTIGGANASGSVKDFKLGDVAQAKNYMGQWITVTIAVLNELPSGVRLGYTAAPIQDVQPIFVNADPNEIRRYTPTPAELQIIRETAAAKASFTHGNTLGAKFGTREPATCPNRKGPINAATAKQYFTCDSEGELFRNTLFLVSNVTVEVGSARPFNYSLDSALQSIDNRAEVYDIRGTYASYQCDPQTTLMNDFGNTHNCSKFPSPTAQGRCWKNTFGDWHCTMAGSRNEQMNHVMPPGL